ncbi:MAG: hypothetical protein WCT49_00140 [Candidatus Paceibacterota bacterium]|jgi:hypothetical protein|nr:hypothetical protein [Candidatus Paceibacterota bacterium]
MNYAKKTIFYFIPGAYFFSPLFAFAQNPGYTLLAPIPTTSATPTLVEYMKGVFVAGVGLAIIAAVIMIIIGALGYVTAAVPSAKAEGKKKMGEAIFGLLILLISTVIIVTINPDLMRTGLNLVKLAPSQTIQQQQPTNTTKYCKHTIDNRNLSAYMCFDTPDQCQAAASYGGSNCEARDFAAPTVTKYCFVHIQTQAVSSCYDSIVTCQAALVFTGSALDDCKAIQR